MGFERVLLVNPRNQAEWRGLTPHLGQGYLAQNLLENGIEYDILDLNLGYKAKNLRKKIQDFKPDLVGISLISFGYKKNYDLIAGIKDFAPTVKTVVGGPHVTILREKVLLDCSAIDYGVVQEGEGTLVELCRGGTPDGDIKGLMFRRDGEVVFGGRREPVLKLDSLPWPRYEKFELSKYVRERTIYSSRGCPHKCIFCPNRIISPVYRARSPQNVVDEMEYWYNRGCRQFNFDDDNFNYIRERVFAICDEIERRGLKNLFLRCSNGIRADRVDRGMLSRMRDVGFRYVAFGADAGNNRMLEIVKKGETIEQIEQAVKDSCELGYDVKLLFVVGTPHEARADVEDKVRLSMKYPIQEVHFYNIIPTPGTELYDWISSNRLFLVAPDKYLNEASGLTKEILFETPELTKKQRIELFRYLGRIRMRVHRRAIRRSLGQNVLVGAIVSYVIGNSIIEKLFYQSVSIRRLIEGFRYNLALKR